MAGSRPVAVVTGASSGIGREFARVLAREGHDLALVARRESQLRELADDLGDRFGTTTTVVAADLSQPGAAQAVFDEVGAAGLEPDVLLNNAGFGVLGAFAETSAEEEHRLLAVNVLALTDLTKLFLPGMIARGRGRIVNVSSTAAYAPGPGMAIYHASKAYVLSFTEAIAEELSGTGVTATTLCPGVVLTGWQEAAGVSEDEPILRSPGVTTAEFVAETGYRGMAEGKRVVVPGLINKIGIRSQHHPSARVVLSVIGKLHRAG